MNPPDVRDCYTEIDFVSMGFHDCYVYGIRWNIDNFALILDLDYIVKWVQPAAKDQGYQFWVCPAELNFTNIADARVDLNWMRLAPECQIQDIRRHDSRTTPNGSTQWYWEIELATPEGSIALWATGFELKIKQPPVLSNKQYIREG
jgi:hypothetical protein